MVILAEAFDRIMSMPNILFIIMGTVAIVAIVAGATT